MVIQSMLLFDTNVQIQRFFFEFCNLYKNVEFAIYPKLYKGKDLKMSIEPGYYYNSYPR